MKSRVSKSQYNQGLDALHATIEIMAIDLESKFHWLIPLIPELRDQDRHDDKRAATQVFSLSLNQPVNTLKMITVL
jgi:hypothetical protein